MRPPVAHVGCTPEIFGVPVTAGPVPQPWDTIGQPGCCADETRLRYQMSGPTLYVERGSRLSLECASAGERQRHDHLVYSVGARWLLLQRGRLTVHAAVIISPEGRAVALAGWSRAGKTTALVRLLRRGWTLAVDDTCELDPDGDDVTARPWRRPLHLAAEHIATLGGESAGLEPLPFAPKYAMWLPQDLTPRPLSHIVVLTTTDNGPLVSRPLRPAEGVAQLLRATVAGVGLVGSLDLYRAAHVRWAASIAGRVPMTLLSRPVSRDTGDHVVDLIEQAVSEHRVSEVTR